MGYPSLNESQPYINYSPNKPIILRPMFTMLWQNGDIACKGRQDCFDALKT